MAKTDERIVSKELHEIVAAQCPGQQLDSQLLEQFIASGNVGAFAALIQRYGAMVMSVCRSVLHHQQDAEDVFQATFLVLARRAQAIRKKDSLSSWLHGVSYRIARKAKAQRDRQQAREREALEQKSMVALDDLTWREAQAILHEELERLPDKYRKPLLLCYWDGKTRDEAAEHLGWTRGTLKERLERARALLKSRLTRRGLASLAIYFAGYLAQAGAQTAVASQLAETTTHAAAAFAGENGASAGAASANAVALAQQALRSMLLAKWRTVAFSTLLVVAAMVGLSLLIRHLAEAQQPNVAVAAQPSSRASPDADQDIAEKRMMANDNPAWAIGTWNYKVENYRVDLEITRYGDGRWSIRGEYIDVKKDAVAGTFEGRDIRIDGGKIHYTSHYFKKPKPTYGGGNVTLAQVADGTAVMTILQGGRKTIRIMIPKTD